MGPVNLEGLSAGCPAVTCMLASAIDVPPSIWVLAGIVAADLILTGCILHTKEMRHAPSNIPSAGGAHLSDLVTYDEPGLSETPDLAAVQKLLFQIAAVIVYAVALGRLIFSTPVEQVISSFPAIPEGFLALLGISTAAALVNRALPRGRPAGNTNR